MVVFLVSMPHTEFSSAHITFVCIDQRQLFFASGNGTVPNDFLQTRIAMESDVFFDLCMNSNRNKDENRGINVRKQLYELTTLRAHNNAPVVCIRSRTLVFFTFDMVQTEVFVTAIAPKRENVLLMAELAVFSEVFKLHERNNGFSGSLEQTHLRDSNSEGIAQINTDPSRHDNLRMKNPRRGILRGNVFPE